MRFHVLLTYSDPDVDQEEMLVDADDYIQAVGIIEPLFGEPSSVRIRALDIVDYPDNFPVEVVIKKVNER